MLKPQNWTKQLESFFFSWKFKKQKTKSWINPPNYKNHKTKLFGGQVFFTAIKENIEILKYW
jgi:hypothetical protein